MLHSGHQGGVCTVKDAQSIRPSSVRSRATQFGCVLLMALCAAQANAGEIAQVRQWVDAGQFAAAEQKIAQSLAKASLPPSERNALEYERERMRRIRLDFSLTADEAQARLRRQIPDLSSAEFAAWDAAGLLERQVIDGQTFYFKRAPANLFRL